MNGMTLEELDKAKGLLNLLEVVCRRSKGLDDILDSALGSVIGRLDVLRKDTNYFINARKVEN